MSFLSCIGFIETEEQEQARLAQASEGSINHYLSTLPVTIEGWPKDLVVELPWQQPRTDQSYRVVVVPIEFRKDVLPEGSRRSRCRASATPATGPAPWCSPTTRATRSAATASSSRPPSWPAA